jgi:hypothetical protein
MIRFRSSVGRFLKDESGVLLAEALILMPILIWGFLALVVYWDVFRLMNVSQKAAYSIADMISRQVVMTDDFVDGQQDILEFLTPGAEDARMRITSLQLDEGVNVQPDFDGDDEYCLLFSRSFGREGVIIPSPHDQDSIQDLSDRIPDMDGLDSVVIVETWVDHQPAFDVGVLNMAPGMGSQTFYDFIVTRPRGVDNSRRVIMESQPHICP